MEDPKEAQEEAGQGQEVQEGAGQEAGPEVQELIQEVQEVPDVTTKDTCTVVIGHGSGPVIPV